MTDYSLIISISALTDSSAPVLGRGFALPPMISALSASATDTEMWADASPAVALPWEKYPGEIDISLETPWSTASALDRGNNLIWALPWGQVGHVDVSTGLPWGVTDPADVDNALPWGGTLHTDADIQIPWLQAIPTDPDIVLPWVKTIDTDADITLPWAKTGTVDVSTVLPWWMMLAVDVETRLAWGKTLTVDVGVKCPWSKTIALDVSNFTGFTEGEGEYVKQALFKDFKLPWIAAARIIMYEQNITFTRVSNSANIRLLSASVDIDVDSWCWQMRVTLPSKTDADLVRPDPGTGEMTEVELSINGYTWRFLVTELSENYAWAKGTYNITGYSPTYLLGDPGPRITQAWSAQSAEAVVAGLLSGSGYTYTWNLLGNTWNLPAGCLSVADATWIDVVKKVAAAVGGVVQTNPAGYDLILQSRYPASPKDWAATTPDATLMAGIMSQGIAPKQQPGYNQVIVSGQHYGVIATVRREGTAGDNPAPNVTDPLLTNVAVCTERGRVELDETGYNKADETLLLPLPGPGNTPALLLPGDLVLVQDLSASWRGQVKSVSVATERAKTRQQVTLERVYI
jgi:hypothetical protein